MRYSSRDLRDMVVGRGGGGGKSCRGEMGVSLGAVWKKKNLLRETVQKILWDFLHEDWYNLSQNSSHFSKALIIRSILNILGRVRVLCNLCREEMGVGDFKQHQRKCGGVLVECVGKGVGCKVVRKRKRMSVHEGGCPYAIAAPIVADHKRFVPKNRETVQK